MPRSLSGLDCSHGPHVGSDTRLFYSDRDEPPREEPLNWMFSMEQKIFTCLVHCSRHKKSESLLIKPGGVTSMACWSLSKWVYESAVKFLKFLYSRQEPYLSEDQNTVPRSHTLRQLSDPSFVKIWPWEATVVEVYLWTAIFSINDNWEMKKNKYSEQNPTLCF